MGERMMSGFTNSNGFKEAVCINTEKVYDSCRDRDCLEDLRVYLCSSSQAVIDKAVSVKAKCAELIWVYIDVECVPFNRGFYTVDIRFYFKVTLDAYICVGKPKEIEGMCVYDKRVILFGSEGNAKIYSSKYTPCEADAQLMYKTNLPKATVEVVGPIALGAKLIEPNDNCCCCECDKTSVPDFVCCCFNEDLAFDDDHKKVAVTLGLFSIVRLERTVQLLVPAYDFCIPEKECVISGEDNPCHLFSKIKFPTDEFFPPEFCNFKDAGGADADCGCCGK